MQYNTGYSNQPIDFSRSSQAMYQSALQMKLADVKKREAELSESQKYLIKGLDITTIPELSGKVQQGFEDNISKFKQELTKMAADSPNGFTSQQKSQIQSKVADLQNGMVRSKLQLKAIADAKSQITRPGMENIIDTRKAAEELGRIEMAYGNNEPGEWGTQASQLLMKHMKPVNEFDIVKKGMTGLKFGQNTTIIDEKGNKHVDATVTNQKDVDEALTKTFLGDPYLRNKIVVKDEFGNESINQPVYENMLNTHRKAYMIENKKQEYNPNAFSLGWGSPDNLVKEQIGEKLNLGGVEYTSTPFPDAVSGKLNLGGVINHDTKTKEKSDEFSELTAASLLDAPGYKTQVLVGFPGGGTPMMRGSEHVYAEPGREKEVKNPTDDYAFTPSDIKGSLLKLAQQRATADNSSLKIEGEPVVEQSDKGMKVTYQAVNKNNWIQNKIGIKEEIKPITITLVPVTDFKAPAKRTVILTNEVLNKLPTSALNAKVEFEGQKMRWIDMAKIKMNRTKDGKEPTDVNTPEQAKPVVEPTKKVSQTLSKNANVLP